MKETVVTPQQIAAISVPVLGIVGSADPALKDFQQLRSMLPAFQLVIIEGASHTEAPGRQEFVQALLLFWGGPKPF